MLLNPASVTRITRDRCLYKYTLVPLGKITRQNHANSYQMSRYRIVFGTPVYRVGCSLISYSSGEYSAPRVERSRFVRNLLTHCCKSGTVIITKAPESIFDK